MESDTSHPDRLDFIALPRGPAHPVCRGRLVRLDLMVLLNRSLSLAQHNEGETGEQDVSSSFEVIGLAARSSPANSDVTVAMRELVVAQLGSKCKYVLQ